jgi:hypothetical protein
MVAEANLVIANFGRAISIILIGLAESDIHGTCLLAWAVAMILEILDSNRNGWRVIKP